MPTVTNTAPSTSSQTALQGNTSRNGLILFNDSAADVLVKIGAGASLTSYSFRLKAGEFWSPSTLEDTPEEPISVIWPSSSSGYFCATEF